jgi:hypothetical protein
MKEKHFDAPRERLDQNAIIRLAGASRAEVSAWSVGAGELPENLAPIHEVICAVDRARSLLRSAKTRTPGAAHANAQDLTKAIEILDRIFGDENHETHRSERIAHRLRRHRSNRAGR